MTGIVMIVDLLKYHVTYKENVKWNVDHFKRILGKKERKKEELLSAWPKSHY